MPESDAWSELVSLFCELSVIISECVCVWGGGAIEGYLVAGGGLCCMERRELALNRKAQHLSVSCW